MWTHSQNSLIDFESDEAESTSASYSLSGYLYLKNNHLTIQPHEDLRLSSQSLCKIIKSKDMYELELPLPYNINDFDNITWILLHNIQQTNDFGYKIREGDTFKFGKFILKVRQINIKNEITLKALQNIKTKVFNNDDEDVSHNILFPKDVGRSKTKQTITDTELNYLAMANDNLLLLNKIKNGKNENNEKTEDNDSLLTPTCRICLCEDYHNDFNPLVSPCKCIGTVKYIHLDCLKKLISSKINEKSSDNVAIFSFKNLDCELCHTMFPEKIRVKNTTYTIINLKRPSCNYLLLEGIMKEIPDIKTIYVLSFNDGKNIKIGRASDSDFRLGDISVSRAHAKFVIQDGNVYLYDTMSKFGSLIKAYQRLCIFPNKNFWINKGKLCLGFKMKLQLCALLRCYRPKKKYKTENDYYDEQYFKEDKDIKAIPDYIFIETKQVSLFESEVNGKGFKVLLKEE